MIIRGEEEVKDRGSHLSPIKFIVTYCSMGSTTKNNISCTYCICIMLLVKMNFFGKAFGTKKNDRNEVLQKLRELEDTNLKNQDSLEKIIEQEMAFIRKNAATNKAEAIQALKRKKIYEKELCHTDGILCNVEMQRESLENGKNVTVDVIQDLMEWMTEHQDSTKKKLNALSNNPDYCDDLEEKDYEILLKEIQHEDLDNKLLDDPNKSSVSPDEEVKSQPTNKTDDDMKELQA